MPDQIERRVLGKNHYQIDALERSQDVRAFGIGTNRPRRPLQPPHRLIAVEADNERVGGRARCEQDVDVTGV